MKRSFIILTTSCEIALQADWSHLFPVQVEVVRILIVQVRCTTREKSVRSSDLGKSTLFPNRERKLSRFDVKQRDVFPFA